MALTSQQSSGPRPPHSDNSGLYILVTVIVIAAIAAISYFLFQGVQPKKFTPPPQVVETEKEEAYTPPPPPPEPVVETKPEMPVVAEEPPKPELLHYVDYTVRKDDMLTLISKERYGTRYYWPLIYLKNADKLADQDGLQPGMHLEIPDSVDTNNPIHMKELDKATIAAYKNYKKRGKKNKAHWLLYAAYRYVNPDILQQYYKEIDPLDIVKVEEYIARFKP